MLSAKLIRYSDSRTLSYANGAGDKPKSNLSIGNTEPSIEACCLSSQQY